MSDEVYLPKRKDAFDVYRMAYMLRYGMEVEGENSLLLAAMEETLDGKYVMFDGAIVTYNEQHLRWFVELANGEIWIMKYSEEGFVGYHEANY